MKNVRIKITFIITLMIGVLTAKEAGAFQKFEKADFYHAMASTDLEAVNHQLEIVKDAPAAYREGFEGALLMKKAGLLAKAHDKLKFFKEGRIKLETALLNDNENTEYHFLRLAIEEHAPKIVKYHSDIQKDKLMVLKRYKELSPVVQRAVMDYTKNSKVLHADDL